MVNLDKLKLEIENIVKEAGYKIKNIEASYIEEKGSSNNLVTDMDIKTQEFLIEKLSTLIENVEFFAEEKLNQVLSDYYTWVIDPIDGTSNYAYGYKHSAISIALVYKKEAILACCYNPYLDEMFTAIKGKGAYLNNKKINVNENTLDKSLIMVGTSPYDKSIVDESFKIIKNLFVEGRDIRRSGSAVLDLCYLAAGRVDAFYEYRLSFWDYAAASLIVKEANGIVDYLGNEFGSINSISVVSGNKNNINKLIEVINGN